MCGVNRGQVGRVTAQNCDLGRLSATRLVFTPGPCNDLVHSLPASPLPVEWGFLKTLPPCLNLSVAAPLMWFSLWQPLQPSLLAPSRDALPSNSLKQKALSQSLGRNVFSSHHSHPIHAHSLNWPSHPDVTSSERFSSATYSVYSVWFWVDGWIDGWIDGWMSKQRRGTLEAMCSSRGL